MHAKRLLFSQFASSDISQITHPFSNYVVRYTVWRQCIVILRYGMALLIRSKSLALLLMECTASAIEVKSVQSGNLKIHIGNRLAITEEFPIT